MYGHVWEHIVLGKLFQGRLKVFPEGDELRPHVLFDALHAFWKRGNAEYLEVLTGETDVCNTPPPCRYLLSPHFAPYCTADQAGLALWCMHNMIGQDHFPHYGLAIVGKGDTPCLGQHDPP